MQQVGPEIQLLRSSRRWSSSRLDYANHIQKSPGFPNEQVYTFTNSSREFDRFLDQYVFNLIKYSKLLHRYAGKENQKSYISSIKAFINGGIICIGVIILVKLWFSFQGHRDGIWDISVSRLGHPLIGTASADKTARIWGVDSGRCLSSYVGHNGSVNSIAFHPTQDLV